MDVNSIRFRCSRLGELMTSPRSGSKDPLSETAKKYLLEVYINERYGRRKVVTSKYMEKGLQVEEDAITLYSRLKKKPLFKNTTNFSDEFITGTPDHLSETEVLDIKSSWDIFTFMATTQADLNKDYYWQLQGYMALTGRKSARLAYCLVSTPDQMIEDEKRKLSWKMGLIDGAANGDYVKACAEIDRLSVYDDIPMDERLNEIEIPYDQLAIEALHNKIIACRQYMATTWPDFFRVRELEPANFSA